MWREAQNIIIELHSKSFVRTALTKEYAHSPFEFRKQRKIQVIGALGYQRLSSISLVMWRMIQLRKHNFAIVKKIKKG